MGRRKKKGGTGCRRGNKEWKDKKEREEVGRRGRGIAGCRRAEVMQDWDERNGVGRRRREEGGKARLGEEIGNGVRRMGERGRDRVDWGIGERGKGACSLSPFLETLFLRGESLMWSPNNRDVKWSDWSPGMMLRLEVWQKTQKYVSVNCLGSKASAT